MTIEDNGIDIRNLTDEQIMQILALCWKSRREALGLNLKTIKHTEHQLAFFIGAMQTLELCGRRSPRAALMMLNVGYDAVDLWGNDRDAR